MQIVVRMLGADEADVLANVADDVFDHPVRPDLAREYLADPFDCRATAANQVPDDRVNSNTGAFGYAAHCSVRKPIRMPRHAFYCRRVGGFRSTALPV